MKLVVSFVVLLSVTAVARAQQPSVVRHPSDVLKYTVKFQGGDIAKITGVRLVIQTNSSTPPNQPGLSNGFGGECNKSTADTYDCSLTIPDTIWTGDYRVVEVGVQASGFSKAYDQNFGTPIIPIDNPRTFTSPAQVIVTPRP